MTRPRAPVRSPLAGGRPWDPRLFQIATLSGLLGYGVLWLDLEVQGAMAVVIVTTALATQLACAGSPAGPSTRGAP